MSSGLQPLLLPVNPFGLGKKEAKTGQEEEEEEEMFWIPLSPPLAFSFSLIISELNKGGLTAAIATGLFLLHLLLLLILTHTAALCPRGLNHLSSLRPSITPLALSLLLFTLFLSLYQLEAHQQAEPGFNHRYRSTKSTKIHSLKRCNGIF